MRRSLDAWGCSKFVQSRSIHTSTKDLNFDYRQARIQSTKICRRCFTANFEQKFEVQPSFDFNSYTFLRRRIQPIMVTRKLELFLSLSKQHEH